jgi:signal peptidase II
MGLLFSTGGKACAENPYRGSLRAACGLAFLEPLSIPKEDIILLLIRMLPYYVLAAIVIAIDQFTKYLVNQKIALGAEYPILWDFFLLTHYRNTGAAFGILKEMRWFFLVITAVVVLAIAWYLTKAVRERRKLIPTALGLLLGGALGNFYDRAVHGEVVDFLQFNFGSYTFPIFNLADTAICIGVGLILLDSILQWREEKRSAAAHDESAA